MKPAVTYIYGTDTGRIYWQGCDVFHNVYRYALGIEDHKPTWAGDLSWVDTVDEGLLSDSTRFGRAGFAFAKVRRRIKDFLTSKSYVRTGQDGNLRHISAYDWVMFVLQWAFVISGAFSLVAAIAFVPAPANVLFAVYATVVAAWLFRNLR